MAGRTQITADRALELYKGTDAAGFSATWVDLFFTAPTADTATSNGSVAWGGGRRRVFPNSGAGSPYWSDPADDTSSVRFIRNVGSLQWLSITVTGGSGIVVAFGIYDASTGGNLLTWGTLAEQVAVADGQDFVIGTGAMKIKGD